MTHINQRRDSAANWTAENPVLHLGEVGWEVDTRKAKIGDGTTPWTGLDYIVEEGVTSVNGDPGPVVVLDKADIGLGNVDNTPDMSKPVSTAVAAALTTKADLASPTFTGDPKAPTPAADDADTSIATTAWVQNELADYADDVVTMSNKDLTDPTNEFPPSLMVTKVWGSGGSNEGPFTSEALLSMVPLNAELGAFYRVTLYCECSNDATEFTIVNLKLDTVSSGTTGAQFAEGIRDHRASSRRDSLAVVGIVSTTAGLRYIKATVEGGGSGSTIHGGTTPTLLIVERIL